MGRRKFASIGVYRSLVDSPALKEKPRRGAWVRVIGSGGPLCSFPSLPFRHRVK